MSRRTRPASSAPPRPAVRSLPSWPLLVLLVAGALLVPHDPPRLESRAQAQPPVADPVRVEPAAEVQPARPRQLAALLGATAPMLVGPDKVDVGDLVSLSVDNCPPGARVNWILGNSDKFFQPLTDAGRPYCMFSTGKDGDYRFFAVVDWIEDGQVVGVKLYKKVVVGKGGDPVTPVDPVVPDPDKPVPPVTPDAAAKVWADRLRTTAKACSLTKDEAVLLADAFAAAAKGGHATVKELSSATSTLYFASLGFNRTGELAPLRKAIVDGVTTDKADQSVAEATKAWPLIAAGLTLLSQEL